MRTVPQLVSLTLAFALQLRKKHGKTSVRVPQYPDHLLNILKHTLLFFPLQNAVYFIMLPFLVPALFTFEIQGVVKFKRKFRHLKVKSHWGSRGIAHTVLTFGAKWRCSASRHGRFSPGGNKIHSIYWICGISWCRSRTARLVEEGSQLHLLESMNDCRNFVSMLSEICRQFVDK